MDNVFDEDRSRVRNPNAALVFGIFPRMVGSFAIAWSLEKKKANKRSTRHFLEHLNADNHRCAFDLVTSKSPSAWKNYKKISPNYLRLVADIPKKNP